MLLDDQELRERVGRLEMLLEEIESFEDPEARAFWNCTARGWGASWRASAAWAVRI
jgi:hypothetical protein